MSSDIKVGDVCEIVGACCETMRRLYVGLEVTVVPMRCCQGLVLLCAYCDHEHGALVSIQSPHLPFSDTGGRHYPVAHLRKKPPKADDTQWQRQDTVPREDFDRWLERVREIKPRIEEPA
jgi:hypothetical protein